MKSEGSVKIIAYSDSAFKDRIESGRLLAKELMNLRGQNTIVLGIPRGGVIVANELARLLEADLDVVLTRKIGAPGNPELAIGAVSEDGSLFIDDLIASRLDAKSSYIQEEKSRQMQEIERRKTQYRGILPKAPLKEKIVIVTDDGIATGATMQASLWSIRREDPKKIIAAIPVAPEEETLKRMAKYADEVICLRLPSFFSAVGQFYYHFTQTEDEEVLEILREESKRKSKK